MTAATLDAPATAESVYQRLVWPALWEVLQLSSGGVPPVSSRDRSTNTPSAPLLRKEQWKRTAALQHAVTRALLHLIGSASTATATAAGSASAQQSLPLHVLDGITSQLLLHPHGAAAATLCKPADLIPDANKGILDEPTPPLLFTQGVAAAAVEIERLYVLLCTAIHLCAHTDVASCTSMHAPAVIPQGSPGGVGSGPGAARTLPVGVIVASKTVVAGIFGIVPHIVASSPLSQAALSATATAAVAATPASTAASLQRVQSHVQPLWFTFLFTYLQQLSAHTPKDVTVFTRFFESCAAEHRERMRSEAISASDRDENDDRTPHNDVGEKAEATLGERKGFAALRITTAQTRANELAALQAWSHVPSDVLANTVARTRFRRAALLFKSFVPHMSTQAPTLTFLLVDVLWEFERSWTAFLNTIPLGTVDEALAREVLTCSTAGAAPPTSAPASKSHHSQTETHRQQCHALLQSYGDRLASLLREGTPHGHLVATALCAVLSALYISPHTKFLGGSSPDTVSVATAAATATSPLKATAGSAVATPTAAGATASAASSKRDEEAAVLEIETAYRLPRRSVGKTPSTTPSNPLSRTCATSMGEFEWRLRQYAPFGAVLAHVHILEFQKMQLFALTTQHLRVGRTAAQQVEYLRQLALVLLYCGVAGWDLTLLIYHFAACPPVAFQSPDATPPPTLPTSALARYTAAVRQYVEQSSAELVVNTSSVELPVSGLFGHPSASNGFGYDARRHGGGGGGYADGGRYGGGRRGYASEQSHQQQLQSQQQQQQQQHIPSRGELQTPRFVRMAHPDPVLLSWRAHLAATTAAEQAMSIGASATPSPGASSPLPQQQPQLTPGNPAASTSPSAAAANASATTAASHHDIFISPCCLLREVLVSGQYTLAAAGLTHFSQNPFGAESHSSGAGSPAVSMKMNLLLLPRRAYPQSISVAFYASVLLRQWLQRWDALPEEQQAQANPDNSEATLAQAEVYVVLRSLQPLLCVAQTYLANQTLLVRLLMRFTWLCKSAIAASFASSTTPTSPRAHEVLALVERLLVGFVMPCLRALPPAVSVYDAMDDLMVVFLKCSTPDATTRRIVPYGSNGAMPLHMLDWLDALLPAPSYVTMYRTQPQQDAHASTAAAEGAAAFASRNPVYPQDALLRKEREALLSHSLKRLNAENIDEYRALLRPVLYAEPLLVGHRLFTQAIGYNNSFLEVHTHLLHGLPSSILLLIVQQGLQLMARCAAEEKVTDTTGEGSRVAILSTFLATVWRDNTRMLDGTVLVRRAEVALRSDSMDDILLGTELCKALLVVLCHRTLEHEEKYNAEQLQALTLTPSTTSRFGRGAMTSFRMRLWKDSGCPLLMLSPTDVFKTARSAFFAAMQKPCLVRVHQEHELAEEESEDEERHVETGLTLCQQMLVHLCRLQSRIYELQRDLDGGAEKILLSSAERYNLITDLIVATMELTPIPKSLDNLQRLCELVRQVGLPPVVSLVEVQQRRIWAARHLPSMSDRIRFSDAAYRVPLPTKPDHPLFQCVRETTTALTNGAEAVQQQQQQPQQCGEHLSVTHLLSYFTAAHFEYTPMPYKAARLEWAACMQRVQQLSSTASLALTVNSNHGNSLARWRFAASVLSWLQEEAKQMEAEEAAHKAMCETSAAARDALLEAFQREFVSTATDADGAAICVEDRLLDFASSYLLPRAVLNFREAATVAAFFTWLFQQGAPLSSHAANPEREVSTELPRRAIDLALTFVSAAFTYFVAYTDGECKRLGFVLQRLLQIPALSAQQQFAKAVETTMPALWARLQVLASPVKPADPNRTGSSGDAVPGVKANITSKTAGATAVAAVAMSDAVFSNFIATPAAVAAPAAAAAPYSLLSIARARGLLHTVEGTEAPPEIPLHGNAGDTASAAPTAAAAAAVSTSAHHLSSAVPLQFEAYVCQAMLQLLTHVHDVPSYAHRNLFLVLEQLDKSGTFPSTLCTAELLVRATEPHASKVKSYYALASAVLKALRLNRRQRRETQQTTLSWSRGDGVEAAATASKADAAAAQARASACHITWRLREHYTKQLLQREVLLLLKDASARPDEEGEEEEEEDDVESAASKDEPREDDDDGAGETQPESEEAQQQQPHEDGGEGEERQWEAEGAEERSNSRKRQREDRDRGGSERDDDSDHFSDDDRSGSCEGEDDDDDDDAESDEEDGDSSNSDGSEEDEDDEEADDAASNSQDRCEDNGAEKRRRVE